METPLVTSAHDGRRLVLAAVDAAAAMSGLHPGMALAKARAMLPDLTVCPATPEADAAALRHLAGWCLRYAPLVAVDAPREVPGEVPRGASRKTPRNAPGRNGPPGDNPPGNNPQRNSPQRGGPRKDGPRGSDAAGLWIDVTGGAHLFGGEGRLLDDLLSRLADQGFSATAAIADTPGAAWAMARFGTGGNRAPDGTAARLPGLRAAILPPGILAETLAPLPIEALRLPVDTTEGLRLMGFERIGQLAAAPRAPLVRRFGTLPETRLDQAFGHVFEPIVPLVPDSLTQARLAFAEPLLTPGSLAGVITRLVSRVCTDLGQAGLGARRLDLLFERVDGAVPVIRIGTARPSRDPRHLTRMLVERLERIDPGLGVEAMRLVVPHADALDAEQLGVRLFRANDPGTNDLGADAPGGDVAPLVDRLVNRLGAHRVWRLEPVESDVPERAVRREAPLTRRPSAASWPTEWPRPIRLLDPPQPVEAMALLPDHPPVAFSWRRVRHRIRHADGPERIAGEWWKREGETDAVRDYFRVEDEHGRRFWLFRRGDGDNPATGDMRWFLHGFF